MTEEVIGNVSLDITLWTDGFKFDSIAGIPTIHLVAIAGMIIKTIAGKA
jgi:hypothetical protein